MAPKQVSILPVSDKYNTYADQVCSELKKHGVRAEVDNRSEKIGAKIRDAELQKINIMLIVGEKEVDGKVVTVRRRFVKEQETLSLDKFSNGIRKEINERSVTN